MFRITSKVNGQVVLESEMSAEAAARRIEGWATQFSHKEPTAYGIKRTLAFLATLVANETHVMDNKAHDGARHALVVLAL